MNFSVKITEPTGGYNNKLVIAIWLEDSATGSFIKTKLRYAVAEVQYLNVWIAKSNQNVVDAVTGATTSPGTFNVVWNGTAVNGSVVPDGTYNVWIQFSDKNSSGPTKYCSFVKGPNPIVNATYANSGNFTNMSLSWTPTATQINDPLLFNQKLMIYPNPVRDNVKIEFLLSKDQTVDISLYNLKGQLVNKFSEGILADIGINTIVWNIKDQTCIKPGFYFIRVKCREYDLVKKINVL
ncbi:MAG: flagellar basal body rod modification protein [Bacteroidetes bacterium ADurb.Bin408]|nr:MAG: flagellar basal body rod modification protein [Bacteroidetes bacterium ADurb.Bin408]